MIYPNNKNNNLKIISPSNGAGDITIFEDAIKRLSEYGFNVTEDNYTRTSFKGASTSPSNRAYELNNVISDKDIDIVLTCAGGDYINQIMNYIDFDKVKDNIKWYMGHSDNTLLLYYLTTKYDIATIYNTNAKKYGDSNIPSIVFDNSIKFINGENPVWEECGYKISKEENVPLNWECLTTFKPGKGRIIGGCLESLKDIIGTKYDNTINFINKYKEDGIIWYFDIAEFTNENISRTLWQFKNLGWFDNTKMILFGRLSEEISYTGTTFVDAVMDNLSDLNIPIIINADIGHTMPVMTIINGSVVEITKEDKYKIKTIRR